MAGPDPSQEWQALLRAMGSAPAADPPPPAPAVAPARSVRPFDFRQTSRFSAEHMRNLSRAYEHTAGLLRTYLGAYLRTPVQVEESRLEVMSYERYMEQLGSSHVVAVFTLEPLRGKALLAFGQNLVLAIVDRLLGGAGQAPAQVRPPTDIEVRVLRRLVPVFLEAFQQGMAPLVGVRPQLDAVEVNPHFLRLVAPDEAVAVATFPLGVGGTRGAVGYCLPYPLLEPVLPHFTTRSYLFGGPGGSAQSPQSRQEVARQLAGAPVMLTAELGRARLLAREVMALEVGDVITLDQPVSAPVWVRVAGVPKFAGRLGVSRHRLAVEITHVEPGPAAQGPAGGGGTDGHPGGDR